MQTMQSYALADVIQRIEDEQTWWAEATHNTDISEAEAPGLAGEWSFKDVVNHLNIWQGRDIAELRAARDGAERPAPEWPAEIEAIEDEDERVRHINAWTSKRDQAISVNEAIERYASQLEELEEFVTEMTDETVNDPDLFPVLDGRSLADSIMSGWLFRHTHGEHGPDLQKWIDTRSIDNPTI